MFLDFGCGAGRSTVFLKALALATGLDRAEFCLASGTVPLADESADGAVSLNVFIEIRTIDAMRAVCGEVWGVLRAEP